MRILIFCLILAIATPLFANSGLARAFCTELVFRDRGRLPVTETPEAWEEFSGRLEKREQRTDVSSKELQSCVADYRDEMERGEFILDGKLMLQRLVNQAGRPRRELDGDPSLASVTLPGFGEIALGSPRRTESIESERVAQRSEHYESLWRSFLEDLRKTMTARRSRNKMGPKS